MKQEQWDELKRLHTVCDDPWYSCPMSPEGCSNFDAGGRCNCGADEHNARVDRVAAASLAEREASIKWRDALVEISTFPRRRMPADIAKEALTSFEKESKND